MRKLVVCTLIISSIFVPLKAAAGTPSEAFIPMAFRMFEKMVLLIRNRESLEPGANVLTAEGRDKIKSWFNEISLTELSHREKLDVSDFQIAVRDELNNPEVNSDIFSKALSKMSFAFMPIMADFSMTGKSAEKHGFPQLSEAVDAMLDLAKTVLLFRSDVDTSKLKTANSTVRYFVEYYFIFNSFFNASQDLSRRPALAQAALLSMKPSEISNSEAKTAFTKLHASLVILSDAITSHDPKVDYLAGENLFAFAILASSLNITSADVTDAGSENMGEIVDSMRKLAR